MTSFAQLPLRLVEGKKIVKVEIDTEAATSDVISIPSDLQDELNRLNKAYAAFTGPDNHGNAVPPPPNVISPARSAHVNKLREEGNKLFGKGDYLGAITRYNLAIRMAATRPPWEPSVLVREEFGKLYANRSQAYIALKQWPEALADSQTSVSLSRDGNIRSWLRVCQCLAEMDRLSEAKDNMITAMGIYQEDSEMLDLRTRISNALETGTKFVGPLV